MADSHLEISNHFCDISVHINRSSNFRFGFLLLIFYGLLKVNLSMGNNITSFILRINTFLIKLQSERIYQEINTDFYNKEINY